MTEKQKRHQKILELIASRPIGKQEELGQALKAVGISTTQSTLSKDMKALGIVKVPDRDGGFRYRAPTDRAFPQDEALLRRELADFVAAVDGVGNMLVVKTITGHAQGVCEALDRAGWPEIVGTIAGENTIFALCRSAAERERLQQRMMDMSSEL